MTYPRTNNGYVDLGKPVASARKTCPNCGSTNYRETVSLEECTSCGLRCDYWGGGTNAVYEQMMQRRYAAEEREEERARQREEDADWSY